MAYTLTYYDLNDLSLYALLFNASGQAMNAGTAAFSSYTDATVDNFDLVLSENVNHKGNYGRTIDTTNMGAGVYTFLIVRRIGASPDRSVDFIRSVGSLYWNGMNAHDTIQMPKLSEPSYIGEPLIGSTTAFAVNCFNQFGNLADTSGIPNFSIYENGSSLGVTGIMTKIDTGFYYAALPITTGIYSNDKSYQINITARLEGGLLGTHRYFSTKTASTGVANATDVLSQLGYSSGFVLAPQSTSGYLTTLTSTNNDHYNGGIMRVMNGSLASQARVIRDYVGSTKFIQTDKGFGSMLASGTYFVIYPIGGQLNVL